MSSSNFLSVHWKNKTCTIELSQSITLHLSYIENKIIFYDSKYILISNYSTLLKYLNSTSNKIYLEWLQSKTGRYSYYNIYTKQKKLKK